jgi:hypothetical protein
VGLLARIAGAARRADAVGEAGRGPMKMPGHAGGGRLNLLAALPAALAVLAFAAAPASAVLVPLSNGKVLSYEAVAGGSALGGVTPFDAVFTNLDYSGGPVMPSNTNYAVAWNPSNYTGTPFQTGYLSGVSQFFTDVAHDSGLHTNSDSVTTQYNDASGQVAAYNSSFGGSLTDTAPLPANGCPATTGHICLTDAQLQTVLDSFLTSNNLPRDLTHEYFLLTPPNVASCFDSAGAVCSANADQHLAFCAYHGASSTSSSFLYANIPDLTGVRGCDPFVTFCPGSACDYPNSPADGVLSAISHEHNESVTDPQPNNAWTDFGSSIGGEIGDKCNNDAHSDPNTVANLQPDGHDAPFNETINGSHYWIQREWSNQTSSCLDRFTSNGTTASASFTESAGSGHAVTFDASGSSASGGVAEYVWQFNDNPTLGQPQNGTIETTSPTIAHTFARLGTYTVALTVMAADGTSNGTAHQVAVPLLAPSNTAPPSISGLTTQGQTLTETRGSWSNSPTSFADQWEDCDSSGNNCQSITGATLTTYTLTAGDVGKTIRVRESASNSGGTGGPVSSAATAVVSSLPPPPSSTSPPAISGLATQGQTLTESPGTWTNAPTSFGYQWQDCDGSGSNCQTIAGATSQSYALSANDVGRTIRVQESASNAAGPGSPAVSAATAVVGAPVVLGVPASSAPPSVSGSAVEGQLLSESHGTWSNGPTGFAYAWERCNGAGGNCQTIAGASGQSYALGPADVGSTVRVLETASNASGAGAPATSSATSPVQAPPGSGHVSVSTPPPDTRLLKEQISSRSHSARFRFGASGSSTGFQCALVRTPARKGAKAPSPRYTACSSLKTFKGLKAGRYVLYVRADGPGGVDRSPITFRFKIT